MFNSYIIYKRAIYTIAMLNYVEFPRRVDIPLPALNGASPLRFSPALLRTFGIPQRPDLDILHLETLDLGKVDFNWAIWAFKIHPDSVFSSLDPALDPQNQKKQKENGSYGSNWMSCSPRVLAWILALCSNCGRSCSWHYFKKMKGSDVLEMVLAWF